MLVNPNVRHGQQRGGTTTFSKPVALLEQTNQQIATAQQIMHPWSNRQQSARSSYSVGSAGGEGIAESSSDRQQQQQQQFNQQISSTSSSATPFAYHPSPSMSNNQQQQQYDSHARQMSAPSGFQHDPNRPHSAGHFGIASSSSRYPSSSPYTEPAHPSSSTMSSASPLYPTHQMPAMQSAAEAHSVGGGGGAAAMTGYGQFGVSGGGAPFPTGSGYGHYVLSPSSSSSQGGVPLQYQSIDQHSFGPTSSSSSFYNNPTYQQSNVTGGHSGGAASSIGFPVSAGAFAPPSETGGGDRDIHTSSSSASHASFHAGGTSAGHLTGLSGSHPSTNVPYHAYHPYGGGGAVGMGMTSGVVGGGRGNSADPASALASGSSSSGPMPAGMPSYQVYSAAEGSSAGAPYDQRMTSPFFNPFEVKHRRRTTRSQFKLLESTFLQTPKPSAATRKAISKQLDMPLRAVQIWFQNRRAKAKIQAKKDDDGGDGGGVLAAGSSKESTRRGGAGAEEQRRTSADAPSDSSADEDVTADSHGYHHQHARDMSHLSGSSSFVSGSFDNLSSIVDHQSADAASAMKFAASTAGVPASATTIQSQQVPLDQQSHEVFKVPTGPYRSSEAGEALPQHIQAQQAQRFPSKTTEGGMRHASYQSDIPSTFQNSFSPYPLAQPTMTAARPSQYASHSPRQGAGEQGEQHQGKPEEGQHPFWRY